MAREFCWACYAKFGDHGAGNDAAPQPEQGIPPVQDIPRASDLPQEHQTPQAQEVPQAPDIPSPRVQREESDRREDALVD